MTRLVPALMLALACNAGPGRREDSMPPSNTPTSSSARTGANVTDAEIEQHLALAVTSHGNRADLAGKEAALRWLADRAEPAYPLVIERAKATPTPSLIEVVGRLRRAEATPWLVEQLRAAGAASGAAGIALGHTPDSHAGEALLAAVAAHEPEVVIAALDGLRVRGDRSICASLAPLAKHPDAEVRYVWVRASAGLGCIDAAALRKLAGSDTDPDVRHLATELATAQRQQ